MGDDDRLPAEARLSAAMTSDVPRLYFNGFLNMLGTGDVLSVLERNGQPVAIINLSYTMAKTYSLALSELINNLEKATGRMMLTTLEMEQHLMAKQSDTDVPQ